MSLAGHLINVDDSDLARKVYTNNIYGRERCHGSASNGAMIKSGTPGSC